MRYASCVCVVSALTVTSAGLTEEPLTVTRVTASMRLATQFMTNRVASHGGYLWRYSADLQQREGEGRADEQTVWVQPPGTPSVGEAFLRAYQATGDKAQLAAAQAAGRCLMDGQLRSGGWDYRIVFDPKQRTRYAYRVEDAPSKSRNVSTLDDDTTQAALRFMILLDQATDFEDERLNEAIEHGLQSLLDVQYPNGAWPQRFSDRPDMSLFPVKPASIPRTWSRDYAKRDYRSDYTFNDNSIADVVELMFLAARVYDDERYFEAAKRAGEFILLAQLPDPQPAWAQQYDAKMHPVWARKFEPAAVTGGESQGVLRALLMIYRQTGDRNFLEPIPRAIEYLRKSMLSDGRLARFYELNTNRPLYFTRQYELTYQDDDLPTHYGFKVSSKLDSIEREYEKLKVMSKEQLARSQRQRTPALSKSLENQAKTVIAALDSQGRWLTKDKLRTFEDPTGEIIDCRQFVRNMDVLSRFVASNRADSEK